MIIAVTSPPPAPADATDLFVWGALLMGAILVLGVLVIWLRRRLFGRPAPGEDAGFSVEHLEELRRAEQIDDAEFKRLRSVALGLETPRDEKPNHHSSSPADRDDEKQ